jgi:poly(3-hydroxybutyrate) depolymerase
MCAQARRARGAALSRDASVSEPDAPKIDSHSLFVQRTLSMARLKLVRAVRLAMFFGIIAAAVSVGDTVLLAQNQSGPIARAEGQFLPRVFKDATGTHKYSIFVPANYAADKKWPVILYLHGAGERGSDGVLQTTVGLGPFVKERAATFPFIVVFPQCEDTQGRILTAWSPTSPDGRRALAILDAVEKEFSIDGHRRVLTGWSMGGYGTWNLGAADPRHWSAIVPVSGGGDPAWASKLAEVPIWAFAGLNDQVVLARATRQMIDAIRTAGGHPIYSELPEVGHDVWKMAYNDNRVFQWMLAPTASVPDGQSTTAASPPAANRSRAIAQPRSRQNVQPAEEGPFIPAVTIPQALYVRLGNEAIRALANSAPRLIAPSALTGRINDIFSSTQASGYTFSVQFAGVQYAAQLDRVWAKAYAKDRLNIQLGLRNVSLVISNTYVQGEGRSAAAGPINVTIGNRYPVWLSFDVTPYISEGKLKLQLVGTRFEIPSDNWYVTPPYGIRVSGLGMTEDRVSSALVEGIYGQKSRIEQEAAAIVPALLPMFEERLKFDQVTEAAAAVWPLPVYRPRLRVSPESVAVDEKGISLVMGIVAAAADPRKAPATPRVAHPGGITLKSIPQDTDLRLGLAPNILDPLSRMLVDEDIAHVNVLDIPDSTFAGIADRKVLSEIIPDVANLPADAQISAELILTGPVQVRDSRSNSSSGRPNEMAQKGANRPLRVTALKVNPADKPPKSPPKTPPAESASGPRPFEFFAPKLVIEVSVNENHSAPQWKPYAHFEFELTQAADVKLMQRGFADRALRLGWTGNPRVKATGQFAKGYVPKNSEIRDDKLRDLFALSWIAWMQTASATQVPVPDVDFGYAKLRLDGVQWSPPILSVLFAQPTLEITNSSKVDLVYETKDVDSVWSEPYTLKPGKSHFFKISDPLIYRRVAGGQVVQTYTLAAGSHFEFRSPSAGGSPDLYNVTAPAAR